MPSTRSMKKSSEEFRSRSSIFGSFLPPGNREEFAYMGRRKDFLSSAPDAHSAASMGNHPTLSSIVPTFSSHAFLGVTRPCALSKTAISSCPASQRMMPWGASLDIFLTSCPDLVSILRRGCLSPGNTTSILPGSMRFVA